MMPKNNERRGMFPIDENKRTRDYADARRIVANLKWRNAKTYEKTAPHEYCCHYENDQREMYRLLEIMNLYGVVESFYGHKYRYFYLDDKKYFGTGPKTRGGAWQINRCDKDKRYC